MQFIFVSLAAGLLLPGILCRLEELPLCKNKTCKPNESCRYFKPCARHEKCALVAICTNETHGLPGCEHGDRQPILYRENNGLKDLFCSNEDPCPQNSYCSTALQDVSAICCPANPDKTPTLGSCPSFQPDPSYFWCVDGCDGDGDCPHSSKCCRTSCRRECVPPVFSPPPLKNRDEEVTPMKNTKRSCKNMICPNGQVCRPFKPCGLTQNCELSGICTAIKPLRSDCTFGGPVVYRNTTGSLVDLVCYGGAPCPSTSFCSTMLEDTYSTCCLSHPDPAPVNAGICPVVKRDPRETQPCFTDKCKNDGDCFRGGKCCKNGCNKLECMLPAPTRGLSTIKPPLPIYLPVEDEDPCKNMKCSLNQVCRALKPCGLLENCKLTAQCTDQRSYRSDCPVGGEAMMYRNASGQLDDLICYDGAPCPSNAFCSTMLMDASSVCCLAKIVKEVRAGTCPSSRRRPGQRCFPDQCRSDGDCMYRGKKCCFNGCNMECTEPLTLAAPTRRPIPTPQGIIDSNNPCKNKKCPSNQVCRAFKPCGLRETCQLTARCTNQRSYRSDCPVGGEAVMYRNANGQLDDLICYDGAPCPSNAFCSTELMDVSAVCCLKVQLNIVKQGTCPSTRLYGRPCPPDECRNDGECSGNKKCCFNGCQKYCVVPYIQRYPLQNKRIADPCDYKTCPSFSYCRRRGEPCRNYIFCAKEGQCSMCPFTQLNQPNYAIGYDSDGCPYLKKRPSRNPFKQRT